MTNDREKYHYQLERAERCMDRVKAAKRALLHALYENGYREFPGELAHDLTTLEVAVEWTVEVLNKHD